MNQIQSLELFKQGENAWNTWANYLLAEKNALELAGIWMGEDKSQWNDETRSWHKKAKADFSLHGFESDVDFRKFQFPGEVSFIYAKFPGHVNFESVEFPYDASFGRVIFSASCNFRNSSFTKIADFSDAEFKHHADFRNVMVLNDANFSSTKFGNDVSFDSSDFKGSVSFREATFFREVSFSDTKFKNGANYIEATFFRLTSFCNAQFEGIALFLQCSFKSAVSFKDSSFKEFASFKAVSGKGIFALNNVKFSSLPDFTEAHFEEAPIFDDVELKPESFKKSQAHESKPNLPSHWRALRRLAIQAHDHERELQFFKGEIIARRGTEDKLKHARFWFGWIYQLLSDFGRSMGWPLIWLGVSLILFAIFYACQGSADWYQQLIEPASCIVGSGDSRIVALGVSVINAFPFAAINSSDLLNQFYACLYGIQESAPVIPYVVTFVGIIQFFVSAVLLFLFLLAVRNNFRIK